MPGFFTTHSSVSTEKLAAHTEWSSGRPAADGSLPRCDCYRAAKLFVHYEPQQLRDSILRRT